MDSMDGYEATDCIILADKYNIAGFHNTAMLNLLRWGPETHHPFYIKKAFERTSSQNPLRVYLAEQAALARRRREVDEADFTCLEGTDFMPMYIMAKACIPPDVTERTYPTVQEHYAARTQFFLPCEADDHRGPRRQ
jgi:hypothetical protein